MNRNAVYPPPTEPATIAPAPTLSTVALTAREVAQALQDLATVRDRILAARTVVSIQAQTGSLLRARLNVSRKIDLLVSEIHRVEVHGGSVPFPGGIEWAGDLASMWAVLAARTISGAEDISADVCDAAMLEAWAGELETRDTQPAPIAAE